MEDIENKGYVFGTIQKEDIDLFLPLIVKLESLGYPEDEAASEKTIKFRLENASPYFHILYKKIGDDLDVVAFINSTLSDGDQLTHESMFNHNEGKGLLCVHSVCVSDLHRRKGIATEMLKRFVTEMRKKPNVRTVALIAKERLLSLYQGAGFDLVGPSDVVWGKEKWFELRVNFDN